MIESKLVDSLPCFIAGVSERAQKWNDEWKKKRAVSHETAAGWLPWFRGEQNANWLSKSGMALRPKLYRNQEGADKLLSLEKEMRVAFRRCGTQLITEQRPSDKWEWYFLMQHYGCPTRLLDWSDAALVALYFAVQSRGGEGDEYGGADAVVYMLDPWWLNEQAFADCPTTKEYRAGGPAFCDWDAAKPYLPDENEPLKVTCPIAMDPSHFSRRIAAQRSRFTIFGREPDHLKDLENTCHDCKIAKFHVQCGAIRDIKHALKLLGISESTIFPDLEGLGRELSYWFGDNCRM
jgi:hypothetical protein